MNLATKTTVSEIDSLLERANLLVTEYSKSGPKLSDQLFSDIQYFATRTKYIFSNTPQVDKSFFGWAQNFSNGHLAFSKSQLKVFDEGLLGVTACLRTLKIELENNLLYDVTELIKAEVFDTHLESAKHLLDKGHKDAAAVIIGGVLEDKLRQLAVKHNLPLKDSKGKYLTIEPMNVNLRGGNVYNLTIQKQISAWAEIRNNAAHGKYGEYTAKQVSDFYNYIIDFSI